MRYGRMLVIASNESITAKWQLQRNLIPRQPIRISRPVKPLVMVTHQIEHDRIVLAHTDQAFPCPSVVWVFMISNSSSVSFPRLLKNR